MNRMAEAVMAIAITAGLVATAMWMASCTTVPVEHGKRRAFPMQLCQDRNTDMTCREQQ